MCRSGTAACALLAALGCQRFADFRDPIIDGAPSDDGTRGDGAVPADAPSCDAAPVLPVFVPATIVLMVDTSGSMGDQLGAQPLSQWEAVLEVLANPAGPVAPLDHVVRFGLTTFTGAAKPPCPVVDMLPAALDQSDAIASALSAESPIFFTTAEAFPPAIEALRTDPGAGSKSILLFTDDAPHMCGDPAADGTPATVVALQGAFSQGITTRVIRIDIDDPDATPFQRLANAGAGQPESATTPYDTATTLEQLQSAVSARLEELAVCRFAPILPPPGPEDELHLDGVALVYDQDWTSGADGVLILTAACPTFRASAAPELVLERCR